ncbi:MAG: hypothetical protein ACE37H_15480 [Phycisphaeraceae bacterium]
MLPKKPRRKDATTLIWEYLEGEISPTRAEQLSDMLYRRASVREQLVESAVLHHLLHDYFEADASHAAEEPKRERKRPRRSSAA